MEINPAEYAFRVEQAEALSRENDKLKKRIAELERELEELKNAK